MAEPLSLRRVISSEDWVQMPACRWQLECDEVHLWRANLGTLAVPDDHDLSAEEKRRAARFIKDDDRLRFTARRVILRQLLARYSQRPIQDIRIIPTEFGKPRAFDVDDRALLCFSSSSRGQMILLAFSRQELGVDVERTDRDVECERLARGFFHPREAAEIAALPVHERRRAFFHCWSRKEAYVKATGQGLHLPLNAFRVTVSPAHAELLWRAPSLDDAHDWVIRPIIPLDGYVGALIHRRSQPRLCCFEFA